MKIKEFYKTPAGEILTGAGIGAGIAAAAIYAVTTNNIEVQIIIPTLALYGETYPLSSIGLGISDILDNAKGRKPWNTQHF